ncbi:MAG: flagellar hook-associated protein FlgK [Phenylobacterium zucineum]|nr:MAG: flagellar hook-associated protein FlgK [Phenylobacterium zucineum]
MSLSATLRAASSGLQAAQAQLRATSDNIANVNTPGYVRKAVDLQPLVVDGRGMGVQVNGVKRITDQYLQLASLTAASDASRWGAISQYLDNAQSLFGDPGKDGFFFNRLDNVYSAFSAVADDPSSILQRGQALSSVQDFLTEAGRINSQIVSLGETVEAQTVAGVDRANYLLEQIAKLNNDIQRAKLGGADASGSENIQSTLLDELSGLMSVRVSSRTAGGVDVRSTEGILLAGEQAAVLSYTSSDSTPGYISAKPAGSPTSQPIQVGGGELKGLMELRDIELPKMYDQLGEFMTGAVDQLNAAHNAAASYPAPATMEGRATGLDLATAISGFSGTSTIAVVSPTGVLQRKVAIDFTAGTMSVNGGPATAFTPGNFLADLNTALSPAGSATFTGGALTLNAGGGNGIAIDEGTSKNTGKAFSHYFGLNDLVKTTGYANYATGLKTTDAHGFTPGDPITLRVSYGDGRPIQEVTVTVPPAGTMNDLLNALNNNSTGVGLYGSFGLDASGVMSFTPVSGLDAQISVVSDNTERGAGGPAISEMFGLGALQRSTRAGRFQLSTAIYADPTKMSVGKLDSTVAVGQIATRAGDGRGALGIADSGEVTRTFQAAGSLGQVSMSVSRYAAEFGGAIGRTAAAADTRRASAESVVKEANNRRQAVEGVNLDEELVNLTTYQQAFNASARMIQAASDLFEVLVNMV